MHWVVFVSLHAAFCWLCVWLFQPPSPSLLTDTGPLHIQMINTKVYICKQQSFAISYNKDGSLGRFIVLQQNWMDSLLLWILSSEVPVYFWMPHIVSCSFMHVPIFVKLWWGKSTTNKTKSIECCRILHDCFNITQGADQILKTENQFLSKRT